MIRALPLLALLAAGCPSDDAAGWQESFPAEEFGWLLNAGGPAADDVYAVGGAPDQGAAMHWDGAGWSEVDVGLDVPLLTWVHAFGPGDVTIVGNEGTVLHWDGSAWELQQTPTSENLWGVWGASPGDLWAVGGAGREEGQQTLLHYDGTSWTEADVPELERANVWAFFKVWGTSADNVYVVGQRGVVLHWDGQAWTELFVGASDDLISLWGTGPDNIVAVGGRASGVVSVWNGTEWHTESLAPLPGLNGVWTDTEGIAHVGGVTGTLGVLDLETFELEEAFPGTTLDFHSVFSADGETIYAVGGNLLSPMGPYRGIAYDRSGL